MRSVSVSSPFGFVPVMAHTPARWRPELALKQAARNDSAYLGIGPQGLKAVVQDAQDRTAKRFFSSGLLPHVCGQPGMPPCDVGTPQSALSGLGRLGSTDVPKSRTFPAFCAPVRTMLAELEWLLDKVGYSSDVVRQARFVYSEMNAGYAYLPGTSGCERDAGILQTTIAALRADMARNGPLPPGGSTPLTPDTATKPEELNPLVKIGIIAGVAVAGIIGVAVITGNVATIAKVLK